MDLETIRSAGDAVNTRQKIVSLTALAERLKQPAASEEKIGLATGRFDLLSREMVEQLHAARKRCDVLVIAVEPEGGPDCLLPAEARAQLAAGLASADFVVLAGPAEARAALRPPLNLEATIEVQSDLAPRLLARFGGHARA